MEIGVRILGAVQLLLSFLLRPFYALLSLRKPIHLPPITSPLLKISATQLAKKIRNGEVSSLEVVNAYIHRIRQVNPVLNAVVDERFQEAIADARNVDKLLSENKKSMKELEQSMPLLGVPITVKESCKVNGLSYSGATLPRKGIKADGDSVTVDYIRKAGGIPLCVTNTPELCLCWESDNLITGRTRNAYNVYRTSGGSSGGEGALLGAGASLVGIGSDIAGSIRIPAMFNGVYGHKPTPGVVPLEGHFPLSKDSKFLRFLVIGPMARYVEDLPLMLKVMIGEKASLFNLDEEVNLKDINVFYMLSAGFSLVSVNVDKEIQTRLFEAAQYLNRNYGCKLNKGKFGLENSVEISGSMFMGMEGIPNLLDFSTRKSKSELNLYIEALKSFFGFSEFSFFGMMFMLILKVNLFIPRKNYPYYQKATDTLKEVFTNTLKDNGVLLYPTFPIPAVHHNEIYTRTSGVMYTMIFNVLELPCTHVPLGLNKDGFPIGIQVIAGPNQDRLCLAVAKAIDQKFGGWVPPPSSQA